MDTFKAVTERTLNKIVCIMDNSEQSHPPHLMDSIAPFSRGYGSFTATPYVTGYHSNLTLLDNIIHHPCAIDMII